jgi:ABC-2 type transport system permease protein
VPADRLPGWMAAAGQGLPITHAAEAARRLAAGRTDIAAPLLTEALVGLSWAVLAAVLLRLFEFESRRTASLDAI